MQKHRLDFGYGLGVLAVALVLMLLWPGLLQNLLVVNGFMPHGQCYLWTPELVWLHLVSDSLIGLAYVAISATLAYLVYKSRQDMPFHWMFLAFGIFITACGATHFMEVWTLWTPTYWLAGELKLITAVASVTTAVVLPPLVPQALALVEAAKSSQERKLQLETANQELEALYDRLKELDQIKSQFFATVSHELRTPLTLILGPIQKWLASGGISEEQRYDMEVVSRNARTLLKHVNDLLEVSKLEAGKMDVNYANVDASELVRLSASHFDVLAQEKQISFEVETPDSLPAQVDPEKLQRICFNLLGNAFKFTPKGGSVRCILKNLELSKLAILVADSGPGVPVELREVIFEPFRQGETGSIRRFGGTGLGLAIVKHFVELHKGTIAVGDSPDGGAIFTVEIPIAAPLHIEVRIEELSNKQQEWESVMGHMSSVIGLNQTPDRKALSNEQFPQENPLLLVIEDNIEMNRFISETLAAEYRIITAFNGREGLEMAIARRPDLIISDVMMPELSGDRLVTEVRKHPSLDATPILILTAFTDEALRVLLLRSGAQDYLTKPFSIEELRSRVGNLVAMKRTRDVLQHESDTKNQDLAALAQEVAASNRELQQLASELEIRVQLRTAELQAANIRLQEEISVRQQAEEELQAEQEFLQAVLDNVEAAIVACDANGVLSIFNRSAREFHGLPEKPIPADDWAQHYDLYLPDGKTLMKKEQIPLWRAFQGERFHNVEMAIVPKQGTARTLSASGQPIKGSQIGEKEQSNPSSSMGAVVVMHDITYRLQAEQERAQLIREQMARAEAEASKWRFAFLAEARMLLSSSLEVETTLPGVASLAVPTLADYCLIDLVDKNGSHRFVESVHIDPEKEEWLLALASSLPARGLLGIDKVLHGGESELIENVAEGQQPEALRQLAPVSAMLVPLRAGVSTLGAISLVSAESGRHYDQTELALAEDLAHSIALAVENARLYRDAQEANRMKDEFLAVLSHELRTPLNSVLGWVSLMRTRKFDEAKTAKALETIERNARLQARMIEELLDVSRIIRGKLHLSIRQVNLIPLIEAALDSLQPAAEAKGIQIQCSLDSSIPAVSGDSDRLQQVAWNLVSNAIKFTSSGGRVSVTLSRVDDSAQLQVSDDGIGISSEFLPYVFDRFRQESTSTTRSHGGLGLGLAIVRHLVELHGGTVSAESPGVGLGATFTLQLPLPEAEA